jgi:hypothetical protein
MKAKSPLQICILEDNRDRQAAMRDCLSERFHQFEAVFFEDASKMVRHLQSHLGGTILLCLDHDLDLQVNGKAKPVDPGTGRDVVDWLATQAPACPVILHSTNTTAVQGMQLALEDRGWTTYRVVPWGDLEWIGTAWKRAVRQALLQTARPETKPKRSKTAR